MIDLLHNGLQAGKTHGTGFDALSEATTWLRKGSAYTARYVGRDATLTAADAHPVWCVIVRHNNPERTPSVMMCAHPEHAVARLLALADSDYPPTGKTK